MWKAPEIALAFALLPATAQASINLIADKLDAEDGAMMPPGNIVVVDVFVDVSSGDAWEESDLLGLTYNSGARLVYPVDPNFPLRITAPGPDQRFVTFVSTPQPRDSDDRFGAAGETFIAGVYCGGGANPRLEVSLVNVSYALLHPQPQIGVDGYVARIAMDLSQVVDPRFRVDSERIVVAPSQPPGSVRLFETRGCGGDTAGMVAGSWFGGYPVSIDFGIYGIPAACPGLGDLDHDGIVGFHDLLLLLSSFGSDASGDLDGDGVTGLRDLTQLLSHFGQDCP